MDLFEKINTDKSALGRNSMIEEGFFFFPKLEGDIGPRMKFRGKEVLTWSLNNYLGLANHPEVRKADAEAAKQWGLAYPMGARMMSGNSVYHDHFENQLAEFVHKELNIKTIAVDGDGFNIQFLGSANYSKSDFTSIGN